LQIGIGMLPAVIAADMRLANEAGQTLSVYIVYRDNRHLAERLQAALERTGRIRQHELRAQTVSLSRLLINEPAPASAIFIAEPLTDRLNKLVAYSRRHRLLAFSPFEGDVEHGVTAGFRVTDRVLPLVNLESLKSSQIYLKAFFLRVAVKHE
jgi:hypothetical protein